MLHVPLDDLACIRSNKLKDFIHDEHLSFRSLCNELVQFSLKPSLSTRANTVLRLFLIALYYSWYPPDISNVSNIDNANEMQRQVQDVTGAHSDTIKVRSHKLV